MCFTLRAERVRQISRTELRGDNMCPWSAQVGPSLHLEYSLLYLPRLDLTHPGAFYWKVMGLEFKTPTPACKHRTFQLSQALLPHSIFLSTINVLDDFQVLPEWNWGCAPQSCDCRFPSSSSFWLTAGNTWLSSFANWGFHLWKSFDHLSAKLSQEVACKGLAALIQIFHPNNHISGEAPGSS